MMRHNFVYLSEFPPTALTKRIVATFLGSSTGEATSNKYRRKKATRITKTNQPKQWQRTRQGGEWDSTFGKPGKSLSSSLL